MSLCTLHCQGCGIPWIGGHFIDGSLRLYYITYTGGMWTSSGSAVISSTGACVSTYLTLAGMEFLSTLSGLAAISLTGAYVSTYLTLAGMWNSLDRRPFRRWEPTSLHTLQWPGCDSLDRRPLVDGSLHLYLPYDVRNGVFVDFVRIGGHFGDRSLCLYKPYTRSDVEFLG